MSRSSESLEAGGGGEEGEGGERGRERGGAGES